MVNIFGAANIVIGLAGFSSGDFEPKDWAVTTLLIMAVLAYAATVYFAFVQLRPQRWRWSIYANFWVPQLWNQAESEARQSILIDLAKSYAHNRLRLAAKAQSIRLALATTGIEVVLVSLALISARTG
jgi:hypothetical protein